MDKPNSWELGAKISKEMDNTCKNCGYRDGGYIEYHMPSAILCWCKYHNCKVTGPTCDNWKEKDMTVDKVPIKSKEVTRLSDGGVEIECRLADGERPDWFKNMLSDKEKTEKEYDPVNSPKHYTSGKVECIDAMIKTFGVDAVKHFCLCNAFKYHWRHELKNGEEDIKKATWYMNKYKELENR